MTRFDSFDDDGTTAGIGGTFPSPRCEGVGYAF